MKARRDMSTGEKIFVIGGALIGLGALFPWYSYQVGFESSWRRMYAWDEELRFPGMFVVVLGARMGAQILLRHRGQVTLPSFGLSWRKIHVWSAGIINGIVDLYFVLHQDHPALAFQLGFWLAVIGGALLFYGAWIREDEVD